MLSKTVLPNGVRVLTDRIPHVRSAAVGIWVGIGSRFEAARENGAAHFIEHMLFKGTEKRSAAELAEQMDQIGGQINAFTTKDCTCFYGRVLDINLPVAIDLLCDMLFSSCFDENDVMSERGVIIEEIGMYEDTPEDLVIERLYSEAYRGCSLARPILGKKSTLEKMTGETLRDFMERKYRAGDIVIAISGSFTDKDVEYIHERFSLMPKSRRARLPASKYRPCITTKRKRIEQNHLCFGFPCVSNLSPDRYAMQLLNNILGGGMSSRLFQELREKRGLCYSAGSFLSTQDDTGLYCLTMALGADSEAEAIGVVAQEIQKIKSAGVTQTELDRAREQVKANILMGLESTNTRMSRMARCELTYGRIITTEETIAAYDAVTREDLQRLANEVFDIEKTAFSAVGRVKPEEQYKELLAKLS
ncbi:MAG TPA: insulinase family protein [Clostridiales bacterium]|jgi:predicted Zn-dependent peptidase|nr:insulinase family protein [Clostridiales bacterium]